MVETKKALILTWEKFQDHELIYPYYSLKEHGFEVTIMANQKGKIFGSMGSHMICDKETKSMESPINRNFYLNEYDILLIPGGVKALEKLRQEEDVLEFIRDWDERKKTIFSICNGAQLLISAKILKGRTLSGYYSIQVDIENAGATYDKSNVVVDENIISCPHYDFMGEWMNTAFKTHYKRMESYYAL